MLDKMRWEVFAVLALMVVEEFGRRVAVVADSFQLPGDPCARRNIYLDSLSSSSVIIPLKSNEDLCVLTVVAPDTHLMSLHFLESSQELEAARFFNETEKSAPCPLRLFLPRHVGAIWTGDPCSVDFMPGTDLLTSQFRILWTPPKNPGDTKGRKLVLTSIGQGDVCKNRTQHVCSRIGLEPHLCVSKTLKCDGIENCPRGSSTSDEDDRLCKTSLQARRSWEQFVIEMVKNLKPTTDLKTEMLNSKWLQEKLKERTHTSTPPTKNLLSWKDWEEIQLPEAEVTTTKPPVTHEKHSTAESIAEVLSHYGPWGYLMLGMLICGTVLMFCGLWECCFRRPKPPDDEPIQVPPTTVLIINQQDEASTAQPPSYEELDQPPSYSTLFPNNKQCERTNNESVPSATNDIELQRTDAGGAAES